MRAELARPAAFALVDVLLRDLSVVAAIRRDHATPHRAFGADVSRSVNGVVLSTIARLAGRVGLSPFVPLSRAAKVFARNHPGGAVAVYKVGPREARFEVHGTPMARSTCHRDSIEGALLDGARPFAADVRITELVTMRTLTSYAYRLRW